VEEQLLQAPEHLRLQPACIGLAASATYGCSRRHPRLQPCSPTVTYGCSPTHLRLQGARLRDPVEWLFSHAPLAWGHLSYALYVLQSVGYALWPYETLGSWQALFFLAFLLGLSQVTLPLTLSPTRA
jgi:hypothetical protein